MFRTVLIVFNLNITACYMLTSYLTGQNVLQIVQFAINIWIAQIQNGMKITNKYYAGLKQIFDENCVNSSTCLDGNEYSISFSFSCWVL